MFPEVKTICKLCNIEVVQDLNYHGPGQAGFSYSCGCKSDHMKEKVVWTDKEGNTKEFQE